MIWSGRGWFEAPDRDDLRQTTGTVLRERKLDLREVTDHFTCGSMRVFLETKSPRNSWDICQLRWMEAERSYEFKLLLTSDSVSAMLNCFRLKSQVCCPCLKCNLNKHTASTAWDLNWNPPKRMIQHQECVTTQATAPTVRRAHRKTGQLQRHKICAAYLLTRFIVETPRKMGRTHVVQGKATVARLWWLFPPFVFVRSRARRIRCVMMPAGSAKVQVCGSERWQQQQQWWQ